MEKQIDYLTHWTDTLASNVKELTPTELQSATRIEERISKTYGIDTQDNKPLFADLLDTLEELNDTAKETNSEAFYNTVEAIISLWDEINVMN